MQTVTQRVRRGLGVAAAIVMVQAATGCGHRLSAGALDAQGAAVAAYYEGHLAAADPAPEPAPARAARESGAMTPLAEEAVQAAPSGQVAPLSPAGDVVRVTLDECIATAVRHNLGIQVARYEPRIAATAVKEAEALFDPSWFLNSALSRVRRDTGTALAGAPTLTSKQWDFSTGLESLVPTGMTLSVSQDWTYMDSNSSFIMPNPQFATLGGISLAQPLLRDAGFAVNLSPIVLAQLDHSISRETFAARVMDLLLSVEQTYWQLVLEQRRVSAIEEARQAAAENLRISQRRFEEGKARRVVVSLAQSAVTSRETDLIVARLNLARASDQLKRLMNDPGLPVQDPRLLVAKERPIANPIPINRRVLQSSIVTALASRPELREAGLRVDQAEISQMVARNAKLPRLDFVGGYFLEGLHNKLGGTFDEQFGGDFFQWSVGVELEIPLGNRARRAAYERARLQSAQAARSREDAEQGIILEVIDAVRNLAAAEEAIVSTRAAREAAEQSLADQQANVTAGSALVKDLLDAQRDLADAQVAEMQAMVSYMTNVAALERAKGTLLEYNDIRLAE